MSYVEHSNRHLDLTVSDPGLADAIRMLVRLDIQKDFHGEDPFRRKSDPMCLAYRIAPDGRGAYLQVMCAAPGPDDAGWTKLPAGLQAGRLAQILRKILPPARHDREFEGLTENGWRFENPVDVLWRDDAEYGEYEPEDYESAFAYVSAYSCEYAK